MITKKRYFSALLCCAFFLGSLFYASKLNAQEKALSVLRITPAGDDVPASRQIVIEFNQPAVPIGRMERTREEVPVEISPELNCEWRWLNTQALACQLDEKSGMAKATRYQVKVKKGFKAHNGAELREDKIHAFVTQRPVLNYAWFKNWSSPVEPEIYLSFNQPVTERSVYEHVYLAGEDNKRYRLKAEPLDYSKGERFIVSARDTLPPDHELRLMVEPGIKPLNGGEPAAETKELLQFATFGEFTFVGVECLPRRDNGVVISGDNESAYRDEDSLEPFIIRAGAEQTTAQTTARCDPTNSVELLFSAPIDGDQVKSGLSVEPDLAGGKKDFDPWEYVSYNYGAVGQHTKGTHYGQSLPVPLRAFTNYRLQASKAAIKDVFGRELKSSFDFSFLTDHRPAKYHINNQLSVLEKDTDSHLPLIVTNLKRLSLNYQLLTANDLQNNAKASYDLYDVKDIAYPFPIKVREMLKGASGVVQGQFEGRAGKNSGQSWFFSQVTPFHVHAKLGHFNSLVWITDMSSGKAVSGAKVTLLKGSYKDLSTFKQLSRPGFSNKEGIAKLEGLSSFDPELKLLYNWQFDKPRILVKVEFQNDIAILPAAFDFDLSYETLYPAARKAYGHMKAWGTTAQGVYKLGDTVQYKIYVRNQNVKSFVPPKKGHYKLTVRDAAGNVVQERTKLKLNNFGALDGELELSKNWPVGWYTFELEPGFAKEKWFPLRVLVSDFTPSPFRVLLESDKDRYSAGDDAELRASAKLHAGGPFSNGQIRITAHISTKYLDFERSELSKYHFSSGAEHSMRELFTADGKLDKSGEYDNTVPLEVEDIYYGTLQFEAAVSDDRGKSVASFKRAEFFGRDRFAGLGQDDWLLETGKDALLRAVVVDREGKLVDDHTVEIDVLYEELKSAKIKGPGNAYLSNYESEWIKVSECKLVSKGLEASCNFKPDRGGSYRFVARIKDSGGREQVTQIERYAIGPGYISWRSEASNAVELLPEKNSYKPGETAKYFLKNPLPGALGLVTIERYGILSSYTRVFSESSEVIEVPVNEGHYPGFYISVVLFSPRVEKPLEGQLDLGKPAFKIGYAKTEVDDHTRRLEVAIKPDRKLYKPRETAQIDFELSGGQPGEEAELAVAVLDESVFDLIQGGTSYFDPFTGFYSLDSLDVRNFNLLKQLIGRQKFEKKGANPGGGGGAGPDMRSVFKFVSYWNPSLKVSKSGRASVSFELPDNLTGWRVLALAVNKTDRMGLGQGTFQVNQAIEIRPALPNMVREGDDFEARFTLLNRTDAPKTVKAELQATGAVEQEAKQTTELKLEPFQREHISVRLKARDKGEVIFRVSAADDTDRDALEARIPVKKAAVLEAAANYGTTTSEKAAETIAFPPDIRTDSGEVAVTFSPSVIAGLDSAYRYIKEYPYSCWEQKLTKAVMAAHYKPLKGYLDPEITWPDAENLVNETLKAAANYQAPNGGMAFFIPQSAYVNPFLSAFTSLAFRWLADLGYQIPEKVDEKLDTYLLEYLRKEISPEYYSRGMNSSVRAVILAALALKNKLELSELKRFEAALPEMDLFGKAHFLLAASHLKDTREIQKKTADMIISTANQTGGKFVFSETIDMVYQRILASLPRTQCAVLSALASSKTIMGDTLALDEDTFFKSVRAISQFRTSKGHWESTQENVYCMNALLGYSKLYEQKVPDYTFAAAIDNRTLGEGGFKDFRASPVKVSRAIDASDPGKEKELVITKSGPGRVYYQALLTYAPKELKRNAVNSGIELRREVSVERDGKFELLRSPYQVKRGELLKIDLFVSVPGARNYVVVSDPIPGGLEPLNSDLATSSAADLSKLTQFHRDSYWYTYDSWINFSGFTSGFYFKEMRHEAARFYSEYLQAGNYHLSYLAQAIAPGSYLFLPAKAEEMYDADVYGLSVPEEIKVE